jgi:hypothetical protein
MEDMVWQDPAVQASYSRRSGWQGRAARRTLSGRTTDRADAKDRKFRLRGAAMLDKLSMRMAVALQRASS